MRVTPLSPALLLALVAAISVPSSAAAERWRRPVPGGVARSFSYSRAAPFRAGAHRGADLAARPGTPVLAACAGTVLFAGPVAGSAPLVTIRCGSRHVTYMPLTRLRVRRGEHVRAGAPLGAVARGHRGLHLGVRRSADRFGYEDPVPLLGGPGRRWPLAGPVRRWPLAGPVRRGPQDAPAPVTPPTAAPTRVPAAPPARVPEPALAPARRAPAPAHAAATGPAAPAPWPVWFGLTAVLLGAAGSGTVVVRRRRAARRQAPAAIAAAREAT